MVIFYYLFTKVGSGSIGTTTTGADVSSAFPSKDWSKILSSELGKAITEPTANFPLFLIDSEGMGVRGDAFDFMTTSPPAIIAKVNEIVVNEYLSIRSLSSISTYDFEFEYQLVCFTI